MTNDNVNHPKHYTSHPSGLECIQVTEHMGFNVGNAVKYLWRCDEKHDDLEDLKKARWYVEREIALREAAGRKLKSANLSDRQKSVLSALHEGVQFEVSVRPDSSGGVKAYSFQADWDGLRAPLYTTKSVRALLRKGLVVVTDGALHLAAQAE